MWWRRKRVFTVTRRDTPHGIQTFSAGHDAIGDLDVFVQASDKSIWKWNEGDWTKVLGPANGVTSFAAVDGDRAYAIYQDASLHEFNGSVWSKVPQSKPVSAIDAITDGRGNDAVFALNTNRTFGEYFGGHFTQMMPPSVRIGKFPASLGTFSAGLDQFGNAIVYGSLVEHQVFFNLNFGVYEINFNGTQRLIDNGQSQFSATNGALWIAKTNGSLEKYDAKGLHSEPRDVAGIVSLSAATANDVLYVSSITNEISETQISTGGFVEVIRHDNFGKVPQ